MDRKMLVTLIILLIFISTFSFLIGYIKGFLKCKRIDNEIIRDLANKYKIENQ
jgi:hypothetical protein